MTRIIRKFALAIAAIGLASCGGGGGDGGTFNPPPAVTPAPPTITISAQATATTPNSLVPVTVRVNAGNGGPIADGTVVTLQVLQSGSGLVSVIAPTPAIGERVTATTAGGNANFRFHSRALGGATIQASITEPTPPARVITQSQAFTISPGPPSDPRLSLAPVTTTLPVNPQNFPPFIGSPFMSEVTVTWRTIDGALVSAGDRTVAAAVTPVNPTGGFSTLDDPETDDVNEFLVRLGGGPVDVIAGRATLFLHSFDLPATATLTVTAVDPQLGDTVFAVLEYRIVSGVPALPGSVVIAPTDESPVFIQGGAGPTTKPFQVQVFDGTPALVPNPPAGVNNVRVELVPGSQGGDRLRAVNAAGATVDGASIASRTINGVASFQYVSGSRSGLVTLRATADRADNNVDNGITDPVTSTRQIIVSDGRAFDVVITSPRPNSITVNPVGGGLTTVPPGTTPTIPPNPNGSYSLTVSALVTDRFGNPVPPGTPVSFGLIDAPQDNGNFVIAGLDGNPQEGGTLFTAPGGQFTTAGGGAGPSDTLLVFGKSRVGNRDLENARAIASILSPTSLTVRDRFNFNDDTGVAVDSGPVLPYVIGRATIGNIRAVGITDQNGVASTLMTYPVSRLGRDAAVWAQTQGDFVQGTPETPTDIAELAFAGVAPLRVTAAPEAIIGNRSQTVRVCVLDALGEGLEGVSIGFSFNLGDGGSGSVNGVAGSGQIPQVTAEDGCVSATVTTTGVTQSTTARSVVFFVNESRATVAISVGQQILQASPSQFFGGGGETTLRLLDSNGNPIVGVQLRAVCTASSGAALSVGPISPTDANGQTVATISAVNFTQVGSAPTGSCTFSPASGAPTAVVNVTGTDLCTLGDPAAIPGCPGFVRPGRITVAGRTGTLAGSGRVTSIPFGIDCGVPGAAAGDNCSGLFTRNVTLQFIANAGTNFCRWEGACTGTSPVVAVTIAPDSAVVCTAVVTSGAVPGTCPP